MRLQLAIGFCWALGLLAFASPTVHALDLTVDEASIVRLDADAAMVIVGNPAIADVTVENGRLLILTAKSLGQTNMIVLDKAGAEIASHILRVDATGSRYVSVFQNGKRQTLICASLCERVASPGDDIETFKGAAGAAREKIDLGAKAAASRETGKN